MGLVLILLTVVTLPFVIGASILIYSYVRFGVLVDRRLQGERWMTPSRIYARPLTLREGLPLGSRDLVKVLNGLKYEQKAGGPPAAGTFAIGEKDVTFALTPEELTKDGGRREIIVDVPIGPGGYEFAIGVEDIASGSAAHVRRSLGPAQGP